jgi:hypothetical protein
MGSITVPDRTLQRQKKPSVTPVFCKLRPSFSLLMRRPPANNLLKFDPHEAVLELQPHLKEKPVGKGAGPFTAAGEFPAEAVDPGCCRPARSRLALIHLNHRRIPIRQTRRGQIPHQTRTDRPCRYRARQSRPRRFRCRPGWCRTGSVSRYSGPDSRPPAFLPGLSLRPWSGYQSADRTQTPNRCSGPSSCKS